MQYELLSFLQFLIWSIKAHKEQALDQLQVKILHYEKAIKYCFDPNQKDALLCRLLSYVFSQMQFLKFSHWTEFSLESQHKFYEKEDLLVFHVLLIRIDHRYHLQMPILILLYQVQVHDAPLQSFERYLTILWFYEVLNWLLFQLTLDLWTFWAALYWESQQKYHKHTHGLY